MKIKTYLKTALKLSISIILLYFVLRKTDLASIGVLLKNGNVYLLLASCLFFILSKIMSSFRLNIFFRAVDIRISSQDNLRLYWLGMFYNLFLPGGIGGDAYKAYFLNRNLNSPVKKSVTAILFDRISGLMALFVLCFIFFFFIKYNRPVIFYALPAGALMLILFYIIVRKWFTYFYPVINITNLQSLGVQLLQVISAWLILRAIGGESLIIPYLFVFLVSSAVAVLPFTIGGIGAREITFMYASGLLGLDLSLSIALSLMFFTITALVSLSGAWYLIKTPLTKAEAVV